jgi:predicted  nucleic acid-binding Zn-ribbon protein
MQAIETMSRIERREVREDLRSAIEEIDEELRSKLAEITELRREVEALREGRVWRKEALKALRG